MSLEVSAYQVSAGVHRNQNVLWIRFPKNDLLLKNLKEIIRVKWSRTERSWYAFDAVNYRNIFNIPLNVTGANVAAKFNQVNKNAFETYLEELDLLSYSPKTKKTYATEFADFLAAIKNTKAEDLTPDRLRSYFLYCTRVLHMSEAHIHSRLNAVKFYYDRVLKRDRFFTEIPRPVKPARLPKALSKKEIIKIFSVTDNNKHSLMLKLAYGMGLRVSEIVNLKIEHIDSSAMKVLVEQSKGKKDRMVNLPNSILEELRVYYKAYRPKEFLFEGQFGGKYSARSAQNVFKNAMKKASVNKKVGIHSLRHSYATHLLESGTDISFIQKLMGHNDVKTTLIYTQITDKNFSLIQSPLDKLS